MRRLALLLLALAFAGPAPAAQPPAAADPALEKRVMALSEQLRCLVCQNQTIADSQADLAVDLRNQVREQLRQGKSEREVTDYMVQRYGDFVLYRPPLKGATLLLWLGPLLLLAGGVAALVMKLKRQGKGAAGLAPEQQARAASLLDGGKETG